MLAKRCVQGKAIDAVGRCVLTAAHGGSTTVNIFDASYRRCNGVSLPEVRQLSFHRHCPRNRHSEYLGYVCCLYLPSLCARGPRHFLCLRRASLVCVGSRNGRALCRLFGLHLVQLVLVHFLQVRLHEAWPRNVVPPSTIMAIHRSGSPRRILRIGVRLEEELV